MEECCTASYMDFFHRPYRSCFVLYHPCKSRRYTSSHGEKPSKAGQGCAAVLVSLLKGVLTGIPLKVMDTNLPRHVSLVKL